MNSGFSFYLPRKSFFSVLLVVVVSGLLATGCGDKEQRQPLLPQGVKKYDKAAVLEGIVSDNKGPLKSGTVKVTDSQGSRIAETSLQNSGRYRVEIPAGTLLPIVLTYYHEANLSGSEDYVAAVVHPNVTQYDINPLSTAIAKKAKAMGGYTHSNLVVAAEKMGTVPDDNKMTAGFRGDPTKQYGGWH